MTSASTTIKIALLKTNRTITDLAGALSMTRSMVSQVVHGHLATPFVRRGIARELGISYRELWGEEDPGVDHLRRGRKSLTPVNKRREQAAPQGARDGR